MALISAGVWIFHTGWMRRNTLAGATQSRLARAVNALDGGRRQPEHVWYMGGGAVLVTAGTALLVSRKR